MAQLGGATKHLDQPVAVDASSLTTIPAAVGQLRVLALLAVAIRLVSQNGTCCFQPPKHLLLPI